MTSGGYSKRSLSAYIGAVFSLVAVAVALVVTPGGSARAESNNPTVPGSSAEIALTFAPLVKQVGPAVVNVYTSTTISRRPQLSPLFNDPFFKRFFGDMMPSLPERRQQASSLGSGVIVDSTGLILTNNHVIDGADVITVVLSDRREFEAELLLADPKSDLAVLRINAGRESLPYVTMRDSDELEVGDLVLAIGNPFGVGQTVTMGIVSALARTNVGISDYSFFIQTDAAINPGNSGGALIGADGRLVGINTAIFSNRGGRQAGSVGIGFAVPSNMARAVLRAAQGGKVLRPWLGARYQSVTSDLAESLDLSRPAGALISDVLAGGPADEAGLRSGDVVIAVDGREVLDAGALRYRIGTREPGDRVELQAMRGGQLESWSMRLQAPSAQPSSNVTDLTGPHPFAGARVANLSPAFALEEGFDPLDNGVVVLGVASRSPAERLGVRRGDVVIGVNERPVRNVGELDRALRGSSAGWVLSIKRDDQVLTTRIQG